MALALRARLEAVVTSPAKAMTNPSPGLSGSLAAPETLTKSTTSASCSQGLNASLRRANATGLAVLTLRIDGSGT
eukprot:6222978-Lingulodinium_polyedra.AAC.1